ncbi:hypothetical protein Dsin_012388 [Dipteronia sinensis]|uniref:Reverse transcriptase domain-containing protein n=1 Tax=Dipteronia sinensis TaxID=43782 RepID=A0AAE0AIG6_9ROSI|nr:hypothetical protein Dsin_012388 [Dipteronia sinensis]
MAIRLKVLLSNLISPNQLAFVPGRLIFDNVLVAFELLHSIGKRNQGKRGFAALKLDMSKAYDRVEWGFLRSVMAKIGFPFRWMDLVHDCISTSTSGFIINGKSLSCLIRNSKKDGNLLGFRCCRRSPLVSHLFFADDSLLFCKATVGSCEEIGRVLKVYEKRSGQMVNLQKSNITFSPNVTQRQHSVAQAVPTFTMSLFQIPLGLCKELGALCSGFWWGTKRGKRKISWVSWEKACIPKINGGLGFKDLAVFNQALLAKQAWRLAVGSESLAFRLLKAKYFRKDDFLWAKLKPRASHVWRSIIWGRVLLQKGLRWKVGDGKSIQVFDDPWIPRPTSFKPITPILDRVLRVADPLEVEKGGWKMETLEQNFMEVDRAEILSIPLGMWKPSDKLIWHFDKRGTYEVRSRYRLAMKERI